MSGTDKGRRYCRDRRYMNKGFLSVKRRCDDCPYEMHDLFHGTQGVAVWAYYCMFDPKRGHIDPGL